MIEIVNFQVNLSLSNKTCKPGENITLSIASTLDSTISLLAIDQRVLLLKTGNDLSSDEIFDDFESYNLNYFGGDILIDRAMSPIRRPWFWYPTYEQKFEVTLNKQCKLLLKIFF